MEGNIKLSEHFSLDEFTRSAVAEERQINNHPSRDQVACMRNLCCEILEPLRRAFGPIYINSGFRSAALNTAVGGVGNSSHLYGEAADIRVPDRETGRRYYHFIATRTNYDQLLFEYNRRGAMWLHVSCRIDMARNRHQAFPNYPVR